MPTFRQFFAYVLGECSPSLLRFHRYYRDSNGSTVRSEDASASREDNIEAVPSRSRAPAQLSAEELLREAEDAAGDAQLQVVDAKSLKKLLTTLERKVSTN